VALSGGPDSTALLHLLLEVAGDLDLDLRAAHFDHGLRPESAGEAELVRSRAREAGVPCRVGGPSRPLDETQEALRRARYGFLRAVAEETDADRIATGHQADDQAETILFRILRGTGVRGLGGIPERRGPIVRPLLRFGRAEIRDYLEERAIPWLEDPANVDLRWARSRIRHRVLPALEEAWGEPVRERLRRLGRTARRADRALEDRARELLERARTPHSGTWGSEALRLRREPLVAADAETRARVLRRAARELGVRLTRGGTRAGSQFISEGRSGSGVDLGGGLELVREFERLWLGRPGEDGPDRELAVGPEPGRGEAVVGGRRYRVVWGEEPEQERSRFRVELSRSRLDFPLTLRGWRDGDRIRLASGTRKLKRLFNDRRVPLSERSILPVVATASDRVVWVAGVARDPEAAPGGEDDRFAMRIADG